MGIFYPEPTAASDDNIKESPCDIQEYFSLITKHINKYSLENALRRPSTDSKPNEPKVFENKRRLNLPNETIHWNDIILKYLLEQYTKEKFWVPEFYRLIKFESFYSEKKWLSFFVWEEFEMKTKPNCLIKNVKRLNYPQSDYFTYEVEESSKKKNITSEFKLIQEQAYSYLRILKRHISSNGHPFNFIIANFAGVFSKYLKRHIMTLSSLKKTDANKFTLESVSICDEITEQLVSFVNVLVDALSLMYSKTYNSHIFIEEQDELVNLISGCLFNENSLYKYTISLFKMSLSPEVKRLNQILDAQKFITPEALGITHPICLNQLSLQYYKDKLNGTKENSINEFSQPYQSTIDILTSIGKYKKPYDKLLLIYKMSHTVSDCVNAFWNKVDSSLATKSFSVDSDNLLNIFDYIIIKSQMGDLLTHMKFVKAFTSTATRSTMIGYYFSSLEVSINKIKEHHLNSKSVSLSLDSK